MSEYVIVWTNCPTEENARKVGKAVLDAKKAACINYFPVKNAYWWEAKVEEGSEFVLIIKTRRDKLGDVKEIVLANHEYDVPPFIVFDVNHENEAYLKWLNGCLG